MPKLSWLHLSDWHQRGEDFDRKVVRDRLLEDIANRDKIDPRLSEVDFIVFSGDAAFQGVNTEFEVARRELFDPVLRTTGLEAHKLFFVPGNHDLNRDVIPEMLPTELQNPLASEDQVKKWLTDEKRRNRALEPFEDYARFVKDYTGQSTPDFASIQQFAVHDQEVALLGLNSSWMCGRNKNDEGKVDDYGFLSLGEPQIHDALESIKHSDVRICVVHHPFSWLQQFERSKIEDRLKEDCHFILQGHEHEPNFKLTSGVQGEYAVIPAGACYERRKADDPRYVNGYNFVYLDRETGQGVIFFRRWSERKGRWIGDTDTYDGGKYDFTLPKDLGQPSKTRTAALTTGPDLGAVEENYRGQIIDCFKNLSFRGLTSSVRPILLPLEKVYVQLRAVAEVPESADEFMPEERRILRFLEENDSEGGMDRDDLREATMQLDALRRERWTKERLERFPIADALKNPARRGLVILGDPGSGKSTLLNFLALVFARGPRAVRKNLAIEADEANRLPIIAPLAAYDVMLNQHPDLTIRDFLARYCERQNMPGVAPLFDQAIDSGRALVMLDGMDEVLDEDRRKFVAEQASIFIRALIHRGNRVLLTSRIYGYRTAQLSIDLPHVTVLDFHREEIELFARQWNRAITEWEYAERSTADRHALAEEGERQLLSEIESNPGVLKLAANPLLLSMLALLRRQVGSLPQQRIRLYAIYLGALIEAWESIRSRGARLEAPQRPDAAKTDLVLIPLSLWLQNHKPSGTATKDEILGQITAVYLREAGLPPNTPRDEPGWSESYARARKFLEDMRQFSGLLVERGQGAFGFRHLTFQEYYVGRALARMSADDRWDLLGENLHANRWREPILLAAAQLGNMQAEEEAPTALVKNILAADSDHDESLHRDLFLACDCCADDINVEIATLRDIVQRLKPLARSPVPVLAEEAVRCLVSLALLTTGDKPRLPEVADALLPAVPTEDSKVISLQTFTALIGKLFDQFPRLCEAVVKKLDDEKPRVRSAAIEALAPLLAEQQTLCEAVAKKLDEEHIMVRSAAIGALAPLLAERKSLREAVAKKLEAERSRLRIESIKALAPLIAEQLPLREAVAKMLEDEKWDVRRAAIDALAPLLAEHEPLREAVVKMLEDESYHVRREAIQALAPLLGEDEHLREAVARKLEKEHFIVRGAAIRALAPLLDENEPLREAVSRMLEDELNGIRSAAVKALAPLLAEHELLREAVANKLEDEDGQVLSAAIRALFEFEEHRPLIASLCSHRDWSTRRDSALSLAAHLSETRCTIAEVLHNLNCVESAPMRSAAIEALASLLAEQQPLREVVAKKLEDEDWQVRIAAIETLAPLLGEQQVLREAVAKQLEDHSAEVRSAAIKALAPLLAKHEPLCQAVAKRLEEKHYRVHRAAIEALAPLLAENELLRERVAEKLDDKSYDMRSTAIEALAPLLAERKPLCEAVTEKLEDEDLNVREAAINALAPLLSERKPLREAVVKKLEEKNDRVHSAAIKALAPLLAEQRPFRETVAKMLEEKNSIIRSAAIELLAPLLAEQQLLREAVAKMLEDEKWIVRRAAIDALAPLLAERKPLREAVAKMLEDEKWIVRRAAIKALAPLLAEHEPLREAVAKMLEEKINSMRIESIKALAPLLTKQQTLCEAVANMLEDEDYFVRSPAIDALAPLLAEREPLREAVVKKLEDENHSVRGAAIKALAPLVSDPEIQRQLAPALRLDDRSMQIPVTLDRSLPRADVVEAWSRWMVDEPARYAEVVEMLASEDSRLRQSGTEILSAAGKEAVSEAVPELLRAMEDHRGFDSWPARIAAAELLLHDLQFSRAAIDTLLPALEYGAHPLVIVPQAAEIRKSAALALGKLKADEYRPEVAEKLQALLKSERDPQVLNGLFNALQSLASAPA